MEKPDPSLFGKTHEMDQPFHHPSSISVIRLAASALEHFRPSAGRVQRRCHFQSQRVSVSDNLELLRIII